MRVEISLCKGTGTKYLHYRHVRRVVNHGNTTYIYLKDNWEFDQWYDTYNAKRNKPCQAEILKDFVVEVRSDCHVFHTHEVTIEDVYIK